MPSFAWPGPRSIAHRGGGKLAPENTLVAIRVAIARGYGAVEFDVMLTADDVPVLMHDPDFGRTIAGHGSVATTLHAALAQRDAGSWFGSDYADERVPRYEDVVGFCREHGVWMNVEIKPAPGHETRTGRVVAELTARLYPDREDDAVRPLLSSFSVDALKAARSAAPHIARGLLIDTLPEAGIATAHALGCLSVHADHRKLDAEGIGRLHAAGLAVLAYTVNDAERADELFEAGVDAIVTDRIDLIAPD